MQVSGNYHYPCRFTILNFRTVEAMFIRGLPCLHYKARREAIAASRPVIDSLQTC